MKKIWKGEEASTLVKLLFITLVSVLVVIIGVYSIFFTEDEQESRDDRTWEISVEGDYYLIDFYNIERESIKEVSWSILNLNRLVTSWDDPSGATIRMEGDLIDINYTEDDYEEASLTVNDTFYSREPCGDPPVSCNQTLCVVFYDEDADGRPSNGDRIKFRFRKDGGCATEDYRIRFVGIRNSNVPENSRRSHIIEKIFPEA